MVTARLVVANIMSARTVLACKTCLEREEAVDSKNGMQLRMTPVWMALETFMVWRCGVWRNVKKGTVFRNSCWTGQLYKMGSISELRHNLETRIIRFYGRVYCNFRSDQGRHETYQILWSRETSNSKKQRLSQMVSGLG